MSNDICISLPTWYIKRHKAGDTFIIGKMLKHVANGLGIELSLETYITVLKVHLSQDDLNLMVISGYMKELNQLWMGQKAYEFSPVGDL